MNNSFLIRQAGLQDLPAIKQLAYEIWPLAYGTILSADQLDYMLALIYDLEALGRQMDAGHQFLLAENNALPVGFASFSVYEAPDLYKLHKIYVKQDTQGTGLGSILLDTVKKLAKEQGGNQLLLNVNRQNSARLFYEKKGFRIIREEDIDIGEGYWMNDYVMQTEL